MRDRIDDGVLGNFGCETAEKCRAGCTADEDCQKGYACSSGTCLPEAAKCDGKVTITPVSGPPTDCTPYKCESSGICKSSCGSVDDCAPTYSCDSAGQCVGHAGPQQRGRRRLLGDTGEPAKRA